MVLTKIGVIQATSIGISATAPLYSVIATYPLIASLVGHHNVMWVYIISVLPAALVNYSMSVNDKEHPSHGSVAAWISPYIPAMVIGGVMLAATGIMSTASIAYVTAESLLEIYGSSMNAISLCVIAIVCIVSFFILTTYSMAITSLLQCLAVVMQMVAMIVLIVSCGLSLSTPSIDGIGIAPWLHSILIAVFAYWGIDAIFTLTERSH